MASPGEEDLAKVGENDQISEEEDERQSSKWTVADTALAAGDGLEGPAEALTDGLLEKVADLGSAALNGAAQAGETVVEGAVEAITTIVGSILDS